MNRAPHTTRPPVIAIVACACFAATRTASGQCACPTPCESSVNGDLDLRLPYRAGEVYRVIQDYCSSESHSGYQVDFCIPEGTPIVAAAAGTVVQVGNYVQNCYSTLCANCPYPNLITAGGIFVKLQHVGDSGTLYNSAYRVEKG